MTTDQNELKPYYNSYRRQCLEIGVDFLDFEDWLLVVEEEDLTIDDVEELTPLDILDCLEEREEGFEYHTDGEI